jgi:glutamyl-tRNA reductase
MQRFGCYLRVGIIGINYKSSDLAFREKFSRVAEKLSGERALFFKHPTVLLSTCNRTEIYFSAEDLAEAHSDLLSFFRLHLFESFEHRLYAYFGLDCFCHLSRVASGLDSAILAETQIAAQVKQAYCLASQATLLPSSLHYIFQKSLRVAKFARNSFSLRKGDATLYGTLWQEAAKYFSDLKKAKILLVGYSEVNRGFGAFLLHRGVQGFSLSTRRPSLASMEGALIKGRDLLERWTEFDWIVCAAKSEEYLIRGEGTGHHLIFDLSVPRTADPNIKKATLWNIEQIDRFVEKNRRLAKEGLERGDAFVQEYVHRLAKIYRTKLEERHSATLYSQV